MVCQFLNDRGHMTRDTHDVVFQGLGKRSCPRSTGYLTYLNIPPKRSRISVRKGCASLFRVNRLSSRFCTPRTHVDSRQLYIAHPSRRRARNHHAQQHRMLVRGPGSALRGPTIHVLPGGYQSEAQRQRFIASSKLTRGRTYIKYCNVKQLYTG